MKKIIGSFLMMSIALLSMFQAASAVFEESVKIAGTTFTVGTGTGGGTPTGNTALKILLNPAQGSSGANLGDQVQGGSFTGLNAEWTRDIPVKIHNKGTASLNLVSSADYVSDPDVLRDDLYVRIVGWNDTNSNGIVDNGEEGQSYGYDTVLRLRNDTFPLGNINPSETRGFVYKFDGTGLTEANIGQTATYDFIVTGVGP